MGDHDDRDTAVVEFGEDIDHVLGGLRIECAGRFVSEDEERFVDDRAGDRDSLLLSAAELVGSVLEAIA